MIVENKIVPASHEMVKYACKNFHYSQSVPVGRKMSFAIFEEGEFTGVIIFSVGASPHIGREFGLSQGDVIELTRVALQAHKNPVSYYLARALRTLHAVSPRVKMVISFSDIDHQNHHGGIYQATNWLYLGISELSGYDYYYKGKWTVNRTVHGLPKNIIDSLPTRPKSDKHKYLYVFDKKLRKQYQSLSLPYPKKMRD